MIQAVTASEMAMPGEGLKVERMPGHWVLARLGKRVLRPGGRQLTRRMLDALAITASDRVVELAPGMGITAQQVVARRPASYVGVDRDANAVARLQAALPRAGCRILQGEAVATGLPAGSATVVYGEAMLTMQPGEVKQRIVREAARLLQPGGRYGIHEICFTTDSAAEQKALRHDLSQVIHHGVQPMTDEQWRALLESEGLDVIHELRAPMRLLAPSRILRDEGLIGALKFGLNLIRQPAARRRVLEMRRTFRRYAHTMSAVCLVAVRRAAGSPAPLDGGI